LFAEWNERGREAYGNTFYLLKTGFNLNCGSKRKKQHYNFLLSTVTLPEQSKFRWPLMPIAF
jgi:hypothetical protein